MFFDHIIYAIMVQMLRALYIPTLPIAGYRCGFTNFYQDYGFVLPPAQIRGTAEEMWAGMQAMLSLLDEEFFDGEGPAVGA